MVTQPGTVVDCTHPRAAHQHGTYLAFEKDGCHCDDCTAAYRKHSKLRAYRTATGTHTYTDAAPAREHTQMLLETLTVAQIEARSGVHRTAIRILVGDWPGKAPSKRVTRRTATALLAVAPDRVDTNDHGLVDATGTRRRLCALIALGYPARHLDARAGTSSRTSYVITHGLVSTVTASIRDRVITIYDDLSMTPPRDGRLATISRNRARRNGWPPPLAWDDDTVDDPAAQPSFTGTPVLDDVAIERALEGHPATLTAAERDEAIRRGLARHMNAGDIARALHMTHHAITAHIIRKKLRQEAAA